MYFIDCVCIYREYIEIPTTLGPFKTLESAQACVEQFEEEFWLEEYPRYYLMKIRFV